MNSRTPSAILIAILLFCFFVVSVSALSSTSIVPPYYLNLYNATLIQNFANTTGGNGTVSSVGTGFGLTGGPITTTGILSVDSASLATQFAYLDGSNSNATLLKFNLSSVTSTFSLGQMGWDSASNAVTLGYPYGAQLQLGEEIYKEVTNGDNVTLTDGTPVSVVSASGNRELVVRTDITNATNADSFIGLMTTTVAVNQKGFVTLLGDVHGLNTNSFTEGSEVFVGIVPGTLTANHPPAPNIGISVGTVTVKHPSQGVIAVKGHVDPRLTDLSDVDGTPLTASGQILVWNQTASVWDPTANLNNYVTGTSSTGNLSYWSAANNLKSSIVFFDSAKNLVGINTSSPQSTLNVVGTFNVTGNYTGNALYGEMWFHNDTSAYALTIPSTTVYTNVTAFSSPQKGVSLNGFTSISSNLTPLVNGRYIANYCLSLSDGVGNKIHSVIGVNGVEKENTESHAKLSSSGDIITMCGTGIVALNAGDLVTLQLLDETSTGTISIYSANVNLIRAGD